MSKTQKQRKAERLSEEVIGRAKRVPIETLAWVAGVSEQTVTTFRKNAATLRLASVEKIAAAVEKIKRGLRISDFPGGSLGLDSGNWRSGERFPVSKLTNGKRCGWCGEYHAERWECYELGD